MGSFDEPLQKLSYIRDECLNILETFKEHHEALLEVFQDSLVLATADLQRTLQAFHELRCHVNKKVNNMDVLKKHLQRKIKAKIKKKTNLTAFFRASPKTKVLVFVLFDSCPCFVDGKLGQEIISIS